MVVVTDSPLHASLLWSQASRVDKMSTFGLAGASWSIAAGTAFGLAQSRRMKTLFCLDSPARRSSCPTSRWHWSWNFRYLEDSAKDIFDHIPGILLSSWSGFIADSSVSALLVDCWLPGRYFGKMGHCCLYSSRTVLDAYRCGGVEHYS